MIQARSGETRGLASAASALGAGAKEPATPCLLGDLAMANLACVTIGDRPSGCKLDIVGHGSIWGFGGCAGCSPCTGSAQ